MGVQKRLKLIEKYNIRRCLGEFEVGKLNDLKIR